MWLAVTFSAIAVTGTAFMVWFLLALLRDREPSVCYWAVPVYGRLEKERHLEVLGGIYGDEDCLATEGDLRDYRIALLENEHHAKEGASGPIALDVRPASATLVWGSIEPRRFDVVRDRQL